MNPHLSVLPPLSALPHLSVLIVEDSEDDMLLVLRVLRQGGYVLDTMRVETAEAMQAALDQQAWDIVIADYTLPAFSAPDALKLLQQRQQDLPFIIVSGTIGEETAVAAMKAGAHDYITKGNLARLLPAVEREMREALERQKRHQAESALRESEERFRQLADNVSESVFWMADPQAAQFLYLSPAYENIWGRFGQSASLHFSEWIGTIHPEDQSRIETIFFEQSLAGRYDAEYRVMRPDGTVRWIHDRGFPIQDATGIPYRVAGIATDITEKKQLETQFYRAQRLESLGTLASGIAHDLNNVLTPILAISQLLRLQHSDLNERSQEMLKVLEESAKRGATMIKQILTFARGTGGERHPVPVIPQVKEVINVMQQTFPKSIVIQQNIPEGLQDVVLADTTYLHQVLMNLCVNARDAMPEGGTLTFGVESYCVDRTFAVTPSLPSQESAHHYSIGDAPLGNYPVGNYIVVTIADTGTGIPLEVRDRIFDPFFTTKAHGQGTGLGLAIVLGIVKNYGGFLQVLSEMGQGTQVKVYLPVLDSKPIYDPQMPVNIEGQGGLILLVDDDVAVQRITQSLLESQNYTVLSSNDSKAAIGLYQQHYAEIKLVILDIMMPNMSGFSLIHELQSINPTVKVIAMSGLPANRESALSAGAKVFLSKPYNLEDLLAHLHQLITDEA